MDRSANMRAIRSKDMKPELAVRSLVHRLGYRSRLHRKDLPGKPDLAFGPRRKVIFVHGCFSQGHNFKKAHILKSKRGYWGPKLRRKKARDRQHMKALKADGWEPLVIWEYETEECEALSVGIKAFLQPHKCR